MCASFAGTMIKGEQVRMYWNHRVMRRQELGESNLYIVEVYYNNEDSSIIGWTEKEFVWSSEEYDDGVEGLRQTLTWMLECLDKPILDEADLMQQAEEIEAMGADVHE